MKQIFILSFAIPFLISCQNENKNSSKATTQNIESKIYYIEFIDLDSSILSQKTIQLVKNRIFNKGYILSLEPNDWQGIKEIDTADQVILNDLSRSHKTVHRFRDFSEYSNNNDVDKIVITYNKPINDSIPNFNFRCYRKLGHSEWQSVFNPGNFRYNQNKNYTEIELSNWMKKLIVALTFK